ncbi:MAG: phytanoyl-CoA dioxygenase family protein [Firmicutes bacterium]|nr:phytanoyl-CoA dioxygenase family protein [Bacillota bacterium]
MTLSIGQKQQMYDNGFIKVSGAIAPLMIDNALRAINHSIGQGMKAEDVSTMRVQSYAKELQATPVITDLFNRTPVVSLLESLIGEGNVRPARGAQIALRFPEMKDPPGRPHPHLDGMHSPNNGVPKGVIQNFTVLVGVYLSAARQDNAGSLTVWPGTHHAYERYFQEHGAEALLDGMPKVEMPKPQQLQVEPGDVVLAHYQLAHGTAPNVSAQVRYALYFRVTHPAFDRDHWQEPMKDIWMHWPGMKEIVAQARTAATEKP